MVRQVEETNSSRRASYDSQPDVHSGARSFAQQHYSSAPGVSRNSAQSSAQTYMPQANFQRSYISFNSSHMDRSQYSTPVSDFRGGDSGRSYSANATDGSAATRNTSDRNTFYTPQHKSYNCSAVSMSMMYSDWATGRPPTDRQVGQFEQIAGLAPGRGYRGTLYDMSRQMERQGLSTKAHALDGAGPGKIKQELDSELDKGHTAVASVKNPHTGNGHFIYIAGRDGKGNYILGDPDRHNNGAFGHDRAVSPQHLMQIMSSQGANRGFVAGWLNPRDAASTPAGSREGTAAYDAAHSAQRTSEPDTTGDGGQPRNADDRQPANGGDRQPRNGDDRQPRNGDDRQPGDRACPQPRDSGTNESVSQPRPEALQASVVRRGEGPYQAAERLLGENASHADKMALTRALQKQYRKEIKSDPHLHGRKADMSDLHVGHQLLRSDNFDAVMHNLESTRPDLAESMRAQASGRDGGDAQTGERLRSGWSRVEPGNQRPSRHRMPSDGAGDQGRNPADARRDQQRNSSDAEPDQPRQNRSDDMPDDQRNGNDSDDRTGPRTGDGRDENQISQFGDQLVDAAIRAAHSLGSVGYCARGVMRALRSMGMDFQAPNAVALGDKLQDSGHFQKVDVGQAREGDIVVRNWNPQVQRQHRGANWGDVVVVTGRHRNGSLSGANDHIVSRIPPDGGRYQDSYVLRYVG